MRIEHYSSGPIRFGHIDLLVCCAGFESRCKSLLEHIDIKTIKKIVLFSYPSPSSSAEMNRLEMASRIEGHSVLEERQLSTDPITNADIFVRTLREVKVDDCVVIDVSSMTREFLMIFLKVAKQALCQNIQFSYTPSERYAIAPRLEKHELKNQWISRGVGEIRTVLGYAGEFSPLKRLALFVLSGFEFERAQTVIDSFEPDFLVLGKASKTGAVTQESAGINEVIFDELRSINEIDDVFDFSCTSIGETKETIREVVSRYKDIANIVICPMNTKLSTLAVASLALEDPSIQVCYAVATDYNIERYSKEFEKSQYYLFDISEL